MFILVGIFTILIVLNGSLSPTPVQANTKNTLYVIAVDPLNATYSIEGDTIRLLDGRSEIATTPHSAITKKTAVYGKTVYGDLNGDGNDDAAILLIHDPGGSGTFFYVAGALNIDGKFQGTNAVLLGDRITPRDLQIQNGLLITKYADRHPGEPMAATPSVHTSQYLILKDAQLARIGPLKKESVDFPIGSQKKITFNLTSLDDEGLYGAANGKRALSYEFCIPDKEGDISKVKHIDPTLQCMSESTGRIGCGTYENLCIGSTHQKKFKEVLRDLVVLPYITRIDQSFFEQ